MSFTLVFGESVQVAQAAETSADAEVIEQTVDESGGIGDGDELDDGTSLYLDGEEDAETEAPDEDDLYIEDQTDDTVTMSDEDDAMEGDESESDDSSDTSDPDIEYPEDLLEMPDTYVMSDLELEIKRDVAEHDVVDTLIGLEPDVDYAEDEVICLADSLEEAQAIAEAYGGELVDYSYTVATISLKESELSVVGAVTAGADPDIYVPAVEPNYLIPIEEPDESVPAYEEYGAFASAMGVVAPAPTTWDDIVDPDGEYGFNDPYLDPTNEDYQWMHDTIDTYAAWGVTTGRTGITVAVADTGVKLDHEEFTGSGRTVQGYDLVTGGYFNASEANSTSEYITNSSTATIYRNDQGEKPCGHGTHVAGIVAAAAGNGKGGAGVAPGVDILSVPCPVTSKGTFSTGGIIKAILFVAGYEKGDKTKTKGTRNADILNLSVGSPTYSKNWEIAVDEAYKSGVTMVASMGNERANNRSYPAAFDHVIAVTNINEGWIKAGSSSYGAWADVAAPGTYIYSTSNQGTNKYKYDSGTSMSAPVVSGACALYMSAYGYVDPDTMENAIKASATKTTQTQIGVGIVNAGRLLGADSPAPQIELYSNYPAVSYAKAYDGMSVTASKDIPKQTIVKIAPPSYNGELETTRNIGMIIYTTDGKTPTVKNGEVTVGSEYTGLINVYDLTYGITSKKKVTIKAACINKSGVMGKVTTLSFTVDPALEAEAGDQATAVAIVNPPKRIVAGKSVTLTAKISPESQNSQKPAWRIAKYWGGDLSKATIDANGVLKTNPAQHGYLKIECRSRDGAASSTCTICVDENTNPVKTIKLSESKKTLLLGSDNDGFSLRVDELTDTEGINVTSKIGQSAANGGVTLEWTSSNPKVATVTASSSGDHAAVQAVSKGSTTVICAAKDGSGAKATISVTVKQAVTDIEISGQKYVPTGTSATYKATVLPANADNKKVSWSILNEAHNGVGDADISISSSGVLKVGNVDPNKEFYIRATADDGSYEEDEYLISIVRYQTSAVVITESPGDARKFDPDVNKPKTISRKYANNDGLTPLTSVSSVQMFNTSVDRAENSYDPEDDDTYEENKLHLNACLIRKEGNKEYKFEYSLADAYEWTSSNNNIATVKADGAGHAVVTAVEGAKGSVKITCKALDGSGKSASVTVNVIQPVEYFCVTGQNNIVRGGKATYKIQDWNPYSETVPSNKNVTWSVGGLEQGEDDEYYYVPTPLPGISVSSSGVVSVAKDVAPGEYVVAAEAQDGSRYHSCTSFNVVKEEEKATGAYICIDQSNPSQFRLTTTSLQVYKPATKTRTLSNNPGADPIETVTSVTLYNQAYRNPLNYKWAENIIYIDGGIIATRNATVGGKTVKQEYVLDPGEENAYRYEHWPEWTCSNNDILTLASNGTGAALFAKSGKTGTATITCTARDGSGAKATLKVTVVQPPTKYEITGQSFIAPGGTAKYKVNITPLNTTNKNVRWSSSAPSYVIINEKTGEVKVAADTPAGRYTIYADHPDINYENATNVTTPHASKFIYVTGEKITSMVISDNGGLTSEYYNCKKTERKLKNNTSGCMSVSSFTLLNGGSLTSVTVDAKQITTKKVGGKDVESFIPLDDKSCDMSWSSSNTNIVTVTPAPSSGTTKATITAVSGAKGTATVTCTALDGSGKKASLTVTVAQRVTGITIADQGYIPIGGSKTFKATVEPANANNKTVTWSVWRGTLKDPDGVRIDPKTGKVTVTDMVNKSYIGTGTVYKVRATATDGTDVYGEQSFYITDAAVSSLVISPYDYPNYASSPAVVADYSQRTVKGTTVKSMKSLKIMSEDVNIYPVNEDESFYRLYAVQLGGTGADEHIIGSGSNPIPVKWSSSNERVVKVHTASYNDYHGLCATLTGESKGTATITCEAMDGSGKKATLKVTVTQPVTGLTVSGQTCVSVGSKVKYTASATPSAASSKNVAWHIYKKSGTTLTDVTGDGAPSVDANGNVTCTNKNYCGEYVLRATAADSFADDLSAEYYKDGRYQIYADKTIYITSAKSSLIYIGTMMAAPDSPNYKLEKDKDSGVVRSLQLYTVNIGEYSGVNEVDESQARLVATLYDAPLTNPGASQVRAGDADISSLMEWTSSNTKVAEVVKGTYGTVTVKAVSPGTATITCAAQDGSGKKATFKVNVIIPVSSIALSATTNQDKYIGLGKSATVKANFGTAYGKPGNTKVVWDYEIGLYKRDDTTGEYIRDANGNLKIKTWKYSNDKDYGKLASINNGKLTIPAKNDKGEIFYKVCATATTTDGTERLAEYVFEVAPPTAGIAYNTINDKTTVIDFEGEPNDKGEYTKEQFKMWSYYKRDDGTLVDDGRNLEVVSSDPSIASAYFSGGQLIVAPLKKGTVKFTLKALDGSNVTKTFTFKILN